MRGQFTPSSRLKQRETSGTRDDAIRHGLGRVTRGLHSLLSVALPIAPVIEAIRSSHLLDQILLLARQTVDAPSDGVTGSSG